MKFIGKKIAMDHAEECGIEVNKPMIAILEMTDVDYGAAALSEACFIHGYAMALVDFGVITLEQYAIINYALGQEFMTYANQNYLGFSLFKSDIE